jgi:enoyl-CoA hydratase/carnithine racemase
VALVLYETSDQIATITLNRPEALNALSRPLLRELRDAFERFREDEGARVAIVTGAGGKAFSAGADLKEMASGGRSGAPREGPPPPSGLARLLGRHAGNMFGGTELWKPLVAAIDGYCLAGGFELALACDLRVASRRSSFGLTEVTRGIIAGAGGTQRLPRAVPLAIALEMLMTGRHWTAEEAQRWGLLNRLVESPEEVLPSARELAAGIARNAPLAVRAAKEAALRGLGMTLEEGLRFEGYLSHAITATEDAREGPRAFAEKRKPEFQGR